MEVNKDIQKLYDNWKTLTGNTQQEAAAWLTLAQIMFEVKVLLTPKEKVKKK